MGLDGTKRPMENYPLISLHGGHSGDFCCHADDTLEDIIQAYIDLGFKKVGITEHVPPANDAFLYPEEIRQGLTSTILFQRFARYFEELDRLKAKYRSDIHIYKGFETETFSGYLAHTNRLVRQFKPDYIVGSVHHVKDICFDYSRKEYEKAVAACGSMEKLYLAYFALQYEMIRSLSPFVVGHFDLIRIHDPDYGKRILAPSIQKAILKNLNLIKALGLVMDFNLRPLARGEKEPYISAPLLKQAKNMGIRVVPGDDSHSKNQAGNHVSRAVQILTQMGFDTRWPEPRLFPVDRDPKKEMSK